MSTSDRIVLRGVEAVGHHGVLDVERRDGQPFVVDVLMELDLSPAGRSDALEDTVSYAEVAADVVARIEGPAFDLIERLAEVVADDVLARARVEAVEVTVHKPQAPVGHPFSDVHVVVRRERGLPVVVALGSNLGDVQTVLEEAVRDVAAVPGVRVRAVSPLVESDPVGGPEQPAFLNAVLLAEATIPAPRLLAELHAIEARHGRHRQTRWGPRTLDLDLIQVGLPGSRSEVRSSEPSLTLPHPRAHQRAFVLAPWSALAPDALLRSGPAAEAPLRRVAEVLAEIDRSGIRPGPAWSPAW